MHHEILKKGLKRAHTDGLWMGLMLGILLGALLGYTIVNYTIERTVIIPLAKGVQV